MWHGFDPRAEPLEVEVLKAWEEDDVALRIVRFRIGVFKGQKAKLAAVYGFPRGGVKLPGLVQMHGGGQFADHKACLTNAKRGYATVSIAWAGRISAPDYRVNARVVQLFWDRKHDDPDYKLTTDWGVLDGYHAPARNKGNQFPSAKAASYTLDTVESPRNSGWFLCALAARRALTFLEHQPEVNADKLGVYGHSMGGKLAVLTATDPRVKAAAPSCGGISDRDNKSPVFRATLSDDVSLKQVACPIIFLSPANDFHGRIGDLPKAVSEILSDDWRVTCAPHHNHQDTAPYEVATQLWFDQHLKSSFSLPATPETTLRLSGDGDNRGIPTFTVRPDESRPIQAVDVYYTQQGKIHETSADRDNTVHRFWHHAEPIKTKDGWKASLPIHDSSRPLWAYANVTYRLPNPVVGAGYYYRLYEADQFNLSSLLVTASPSALQAAKVRSTLRPNTLIEDFSSHWQKEWFSYRPESWPVTTNKLYAEQFKAPPGAALSLEVAAAQKNKLVVLIDKHAAEIQLQGGGWEQISLKPSDLKNFDGESLASWADIRQLKISDAERLRPSRGDARNDRIVGANWKGAPPKFRNLHWKTD